MKRAIHYGLLSAGRRRRTLVLPGLTVATGAFLLVLVVALMPAVLQAGAAFRDGERRAFAGRSERRDAVNALRHQRANVRRHAGVVDRAFARERRQRRAPQAADR